MSTEHDPKPDPVEQQKEARANESEAEKEQAKLSLGDLISHDAHAFDSPNAIAHQPGGAQDFAPTDLTLTQQPIPKIEPQILPGTDIGRNLGAGLTKELSIELSGDKAVPHAGDQTLGGAAHDFKWAPENKLGASANLGITFPLGGRQFFQARKSDFTASTDDKPIANFKPEIDSFLSDTQAYTGKTLSPAERHDIEKSREAILNASTTSEALSNTLHLARLYQHLQYIEEAKKAVSLSLGIDPDNTQGKQMFKELERTHPIDLGSVAPHVVDSYLTKSSLRKRILALSGGRVVVAGDLLIDELLEGKPERISREAPVLILEHVDTELILGGAANTAHNISALGGYCHAIGVCGDDEYAVKLGRLLESCDISHGLVRDASRPTTVKTRILSKSHSLMQQLLRLDRISHERISEEIEASIIEKIKEALGGYKAIVLSDYKAGVITDAVIETCREVSQRQEILVIVDAQGDFSRFSGVSLITPNQPDIEKALGFELSTGDNLRRAGDQILQATGARALLITRGADGMALFQKNHDLVELPVFNKSEVFDVTGAGDTVVGTMALALVTGSNFVEAMALGNLAAGIVVRKSGTAVTTQEEMLENLDRLNLPE